MTSLPTAFGPYVLLERLGGGGMGEVFRARPIEGTDEVVIKRLHASLATEPEFEQRFAHEAMLAMKVDSPHVARVLDHGQVEGVPYLVMAYVDGWSVAALIERLKRAGRAATVPLVVDTIEGALAGLAALHEATDPATGAPLGIVHRDISPRNILVDRTGRAVLIDLGLGHSMLKDWQTRTGRVMGTVGYMSPEQVRAKTVDHRTDLYALGTVLFEMLTMQPYIPPGPMGVRLRETGSPVFRAPSSVRQDLPEALDAVLARALAPDPDERFQSARAFSSALRQAAPATLGPDTVATVVRTVVRGDAPSADGVALMATAVVTHAGPAPAASRRLPALAVGLGTLAAGATILVLAMPKTDVPASESASRPAAPAIVRATIGASAPVAKTSTSVTAPPPSTRAAVPPPAAAVKWPARASRRQARQRPAKTTPRAAAPPPSAAPPPLSLKEQVRALHARATAVLRDCEPGTPKAHAIEKIIADVLLEAGSDDTEQARHRIHSLAAQLGALSQAR